MVRNDRVNGGRRMSVLIKGIGMPEDCFSCPLKEEGFCNITNAYAGEINERNSDCPLVELPEHHGRIIDEDEIIVPSLSSWADQVIAADAIQDAPTVIEAE